MTTAKLISNRGTHTVVVLVDGKAVERDWSFKKVAAKKILAKLVEKYSITPDNIVIV